MCAMIHVPGTIHMSRCISVKEKEVPRRQKVWNKEKTVKGKNFVLFFLHILLFFGNEEVYKYEIWQGESFTFFLFPYSHIKYSTVPHFYFDVRYVKKNQSLKQFQMSAAHEIWAVTITVEFQ